MSLETEVDTTSTPADSAPGLIHLVCCIDADRAYCGTRRDGRPFTELDASCVVCIDLFESRCECPVLRRRCPRDDRQDIGTTGGGTGAIDT